MVVCEKSKRMVSACEIIYDTPPQKNDKMSMCTILAVVIMIIYLYMVVQTDYSNEPYQRHYSIQSFLAPTTKKLKPANKIAGIKEKLKGVTGNVADAIDAPGAEKDENAYKKCTDKQKTINKQELEKIVKSSDKMIVMFWAPWCPHCHSSMRDFNVASTKSDTPYLMVNAETVDRSAFTGENAIVPLTHFPFMCRMENGSVVRVSKKAPTSENILSELDANIDDSAPAPPDEDSSFELFE